MTQFLQIALATTIFSGLLLLKQTQPRTGVISPSVRGRAISIALLWLYLLINVLNVQTRDMDELTSAGLSLQNRIQVLLVLVAAAWAAALLLLQRVQIRYLISGSGFWIFCLVGIYAFSTLWSTWPSLTFFRVVELAAFWILAAHVFAHSNWFRSVDRFLWTVLLLYLLRGVLHLMGLVEGESSGNAVIGLMRSNTGSMIAGLLFLWTLHRCVVERNWRQGWKLAFQFAALLLFGSLATVLTLFVCLFIYVLLGASFELRAVFLCSAIVTALAIPNVLIIMTGQVVDPLIVFVGDLFSKPTEHITGMTGRVELWSGIWEATRSSPWGFGYAALERTFALGANSMSWTAGNAHNGFISAWLGAGVLAVAFVVALFGSLANAVFRSNSPLLPLVVATITLIAVNNMSVPAVGGRLTVILMVLMALTHLPSHSRAAGNVGIARQEICHE